MSCACRAAPWRHFVQGLAQVHKLEASSSSSSSSFLPLRLRQSLPQSPIHRQNHLSRGSQARGLHVSRSLQQDAVAVAAPSKQGAAQEASTVSEETGIASPQSEQAAETSPAEKPKKKRGRKPKSLPQDVVLDPTKPKPKSKAKPIEQRRKTISYAGPEPDNPEQPRFPTRYASQETRGGSASPAKFDTTGSRFGDDDPFPRPKKENWQIQKEALKQKFPEGWKPKKRLSPDALAGIRALNAQFPDVYTTQALANRFEVPAEAIRRILKSKWQPSAEEDENRQERWFRRGMSVWDQKAALGVKPPKKWRQEGITRDPSYHEWSKKASEREKEWEEEETEKYRATLRKRAAKKVL